MPTPLGAGDGAGAGAGADAMNVSRIQLLVRSLRLAPTCFVTAKVGGNLAVDSQPGECSTLTLTLPRPR